MFIIRYGEYNILKNNECIIIFASGKTKIKIRTYMYKYYSINNIIKFYCMYTDLKKYNNIIN